MISILSFTVYHLFITTIIATKSQAPMLLSMLSHRNLSEGTRFHLSCSILEGSLPVFFQWYKDDLVIKSNSESNYKIENFEQHSTLTIAKVHRSDSANYTCFVRNAFGTDKQSVLLTIKVPPIWTKEPNDIRANAGDDLHIECKADGLPKPTIKWIGSKGIVFEGEILSLSKITKNMIDKYECIADNGIGDALTKVITIYFSGKKFAKKF